MTAEQILATALVGTYATGFAATLWEARAQHPEERVYLLLALPVATLWPVFYVWKRVREVWR